MASRYFRRQQVFLSGKETAYLRRDLGSRLQNRLRCRSDDFTFLQYFFELSKASSSAASRPWRVFDCEASEIILPLAAELFRIKSIL